MTTSLVTKSGYIVQGGFGHTALIKDRRRKCSKFEIFSPVRKDRRHIAEKKNFLSSSNMLVGMLLLLSSTRTCLSFRANLAPRKVSPVMKSKKPTSGMDIMDSYIVAIADEENLDGALETLSDDKNLMILEGLNTGSANNVMGFVSRLIKEGSARDMIANFPEPPLKVTSNNDLANRSPSKVSRSALRTTPRSNSVVSNNDKTVTNTGKDSLKDVASGIFKACALSTFGVVIANAFAVHNQLPRSSHLWKLCISLFVWSVGQQSLKVFSKCLKNYDEMSKGFTSKACLINAALLSILSVAFTIPGSGEHYWLSAAFRLPLRLVANIIIVKGAWNAFIRNEVTTNYVGEKPVSFACLLLSFL